MELRSVKAGLQALAVGRTRGREPTSGLPLPPLVLRAGGRHFRSDGNFVAGARSDARRLTDLAGLDADSRVLDLGCGSGRLAIGIVAELGAVRSYVGLDVDPSAIRWASRHLAPRAGFLEFHTVDVYNERYNPSGAAPGEGFRLPVQDAAFDVAYAYSLFSHMVADDVRRYCAEITRGLCAGGRALFTAFVEDGVPDQAVNPEGYGPVRWRGALHCVRFDRGFFESLLTAAGLAVVDFRPGGETDGQSLYVASPGA